MKLSLDEPRTRDSLRRAAVYELLALGFTYPEPQGLARMRDVTSLVREELGRTDGDLAPLLDQIPTPNQVVAESEHTQLFSGEVPCSPHETEYETDPFAKTRQLADIAGFYLAFGLEVSEEHKTMADFIGTEVEFMGLLCRKEALAASEGWSERLEISVEAQRAFLEGHLARWTGVFCKELRRVATQRELGAFYPALADILKIFVQREAVGLGADAVLLKHRMLSVGDALAPMCDPRVAGCMPKADQN